jgi:hypothetical protein
VAYFNEIRFTTVEEYFQEIPTSQPVPQTHRVGERSGTVQPIEPSLPQAMASSGVQLLDQITRGAEWWRENVSENRAAKDAVDAAAAALPAGQYRAQVYHQGDDDQSTVVWAGDEPPSYIEPARVDVGWGGKFFVSEKQKWVTFQGKRDATEPLPSEIKYVDSNGKPQTITVTRTGSNPGTSPQSKRKADFISREPTDIVRHGDRREMPADAKFDRTYPGPRNPGNVA